MEYQELASDRAGEPSEMIRQRIVPARAIQVERFRGERFFTNARMDMRHVRKHCMLDGDGQMLVRQAMESLGLSARAYGKILKLARTIADLEGIASIRVQHVSEAVNCRSLERALE